MGSEKLARVELRMWFGETDGDPDERVTVNDPSTPHRVANGGAVLETGIDHLKAVLDAHEAGECNCMTDAEGGGDDAE